MFTASSIIHYYSPKKHSLACGTKTRRNATPDCVSDREAFAAALARGVGCAKCEATIATWDRIAAKIAARKAAQ
jgi:hypothetical protein